MKKLLFLAAAIVVLVIGYQNYQKRKELGLGTPSTPAVSLDSNADVSNLVATDVHCLDQGIVTQIAGKTYQLQSENYTPAVRLLNCTYISNETVSNVNPSMSYKEQLTSDANGVWSRKQDSLKSSSTYQVSGDYPNAFAVANPVKEIDQSTFYGAATGKYIELTYTPVAEGAPVMFTNGMKLIEKALSN